MTKEELQIILHTLGLDYEAEANQLYVFYVLPDGRIDNFSLNIRVGDALTDEEVVALMRREYPASRQASVFAIERPAFPLPDDEWLDTVDVCQMFKVTSRTLRNWSHAGRLHPHRIGNRVYYNRSQINELLALSGR